MMKGMSKHMRTRKTASSPHPRNSPSHSRQIKQRKTFTLSPQSVALLEKLSSQRGAHGQESVSAVLDDLLIAYGEEQRRREIERGTQKYYDERSAEDEEEEIAWAKFALSQFPLRDVTEGGNK
jgi:hypothetical protein